MSGLKDHYKRFYERGINAVKNKADYSVYESIGEYYEKVIGNAPSYYTRFDMAKKRAAFYKYKAIKNLHDNLIEFEGKFTAGGGKVIYAEDAAGALNEIALILSQHTRKQLLLSSEQILDEIGLEPYLTSKGQNYTMLSLHRLFAPVHPDTFENINKGLTKKLQAEKFSGNTVNVLDLYKKQSLNKAYGNSVSIMAADSLVADIGGVVFLDQTGELAIQNSFSKVQIIVAGIDRLISSITELELLNTLKSTHRYGDCLPWNQTIVTGPKQEREIDGPEEMYVIWVDNGRSKIMGYKNQRTVLHCIRCGACEALCPVFKFVKSSSGELGKSDRDNPLSCVTLPIEGGFDKYAYLSFACTLCGKCQEVCPVRIPLPELILCNRREAVEKNNGFGLNKSQIKTLKKMFLKRKAMESPYNKFILKASGIKKEFGTQRVFPDFSQKSFHVLWSEAAGIYTAQNK